MKLAYDIEQMNRRLHRRITPEELFALGIAFGMVGIFIWLSPTLSYAYYDFKNYLNTAHNNFSIYYYGYWLLPIFAVLAKLPLNVAYGIWCSINILGIFFAVRVFDGRPLLVLVSYQMFYNLIYGNIAGLIVGGLALCWWGLRNQKWQMAGLGIALASAKYQIGLTGILLLLLAAPEMSWKDRIRVMVVPALIWLASLVLYPGWPLQALDIITHHPPNELGSISLWRWLGPWALLFWLPPLLLNLEPPRRFIALVAAMGLALPYFQQGDLLFLLVMPIGWIGLLGNLGYLMGMYGWMALQWLAILPLAVYVVALKPGLITFFKVILDKPKKEVDKL